MIEKDNQIAKLRTDLESKTSQISILESNILELKSQSERERQVYLQQIILAKDFAMEMFNKFLDLENALKKK
jgi:hypothetical protein